MKPIKTRRLSLALPFSEQGAQLLEFALALPILLAMLLGVIDFGRLAYVYIETANAARAGVAYGAQNHVTASDTAGITSAALNDVSANVTGMTVTPTHFCKCANGTTSGGCTISTCTGANNPLNEYVQVDTKSNVQRLVPFSGTAQHRHRKWAGHHANGPIDLLLKRDRLMMKRRTRVQLTGADGANCRGFHAC